MYLLASCKYACMISRHTLITKICKSTTYSNRQKPKSFLILKYIWQIKFKLFRRLNPLYFYIWKFLKFVLFTYMIYSCTSRRRNIFFGSYYYEVSLIFIIFYHYEFRYAIYFYKKWYTLVSVQTYKKNSLLSDHINFLKWGAYRSEAPRSPVLKSLYDLIVYFLLRTE